MKLNNGNNGYRLTMFRRTSNGDPVISPVDLNQQVSEEVYNLVKGIAIDENRCSLKKDKQNKELIRIQQMKIRALEREKEAQESLRQEISMLKDKIAGIRKAVSGV
jgi:hypothetical protein